MHGTWSNSSTWEKPIAIATYAHKKFGNKRYNFGYNWSGGNYAHMRTKAAEDLIPYIRALRKNVDPSEPLTLVGHSHGGNVIIEAINMMVEMPEFTELTINLITINTPVRSDYQLSDNAKKRVGEHINVFDSKDPIQSKGGNSIIVLPNKPTTKKPGGEYGGAGRKFPNATNIEVDNPQDFLHDWHNSHNRTQDWVNK